MKTDEIAKNNCVILPFKKKKLDTNYNSSIAILLAVDIDCEKKDAISFSSPNVDFVTSP